jgi:hypothetical protein
MPFVYSLFFFLHYPYLSIPSQKATEELAELEKEQSNWVEAYESLKTKSAQELTDFSRRQVELVEQCEQWETECQALRGKEDDNSDIRVLQDELSQKNRELSSLKRQLSGSKSAVSFNLSSSI